MDKRKNVALYIGMLETEFTREICEGALLGAEQCDVNLFVLPGGLIDAEYADKDFEEYRRQYNILFSYASMCSFDAIIMEYGTITSGLSDEKKKILMQQMGDVPVVLIASDVEGYSSICIDNKAGIKDAVSHLIEHHQCSRIGFVSGPKTSQDANERLQAYRDAMREHNLEVPDEWIGYGNFSEYCEKQIEEYILANRNLEAIVFANDQMALCGYTVMERLKLTPKDDIKIIGFDDNPIAMLMEPHLSSVKIDAKELGYQAVIACKDVMDGKEVHKNIKPKLITRESCGCDDTGVIEESVNLMLSESLDSLLQHLASDMVEKYINVYFDDKEKEYIKIILNSYFEYYFNMFHEDRTLDLNEEDFSREYRKYIQICQKGYMNLKDFLVMDQMLYVYFCNMIDNKDDKLRLLERILVLRRELIGSVTTQSIVLEQKNKLFEPIMASIISDMLYYSRNEKKIYKTIIDKFKKLGFLSSCIVMYDKPIVMSTDKTWELPEHFYVKAAHNFENINLDEKKAMQLSDIFTSQFIPANRRFDMLVIPLFSNFVQYGILLIEADSEYYQYAVEIACQISVSIEVIEILKKQNAIKVELERNLEQTVEKNQKLDEMSRMDSLTGILNRRGFMNSVKKIVCDKKNFGKTAIALYADMDNLKIINDEFGHDEGDYSLKLIAKALSESFRQSDVVARMGGDEFAAFAIVSQANFSSTIKERIHSILAHLNENNDKPYYVHISVGIAEFVIEDISNIEHVLTKADKNLYIEKKNKVKVVYKN